MADAGGVEVPPNAEKGLPTAQEPSELSGTPAPSDLSQLPPLPFLSIVMPCLNEASVVEKSLRETAKVLRDCQPDPFEILLVDDGSTDGTWDVAKQVAATIPEVHIARIPVNGGKGNAQRKAFEMTRGDIVCFLDGDLDIHPRHLPPFVQILKNDHTQVVIGSKRHPLSKIEYPLRRRFLSSGYEMLVRALFGLQVRDTQTGIKVFRRNVLQAVLPRGLVKRYAFDAELLILAKKMGFKIVEAPIETDSWESRGSGVVPREIVRMLKDTLGIFYRLYVTKYYEASPPTETTGKGA